jgi:hypothetical protein
MRRYEIAMPLSYADQQRSPQARDETLRIPSTTAYRRILQRSPQARDKTAIRVICAGSARTSAARLPATLAPLVINNPAVATLAEGDRVSCDYGDRLLQHAAYQSRAHPLHRTLPIRK